MKEITLTVGEYLLNRGETLESIRFKVYEYPNYETVALINEVKPPDEPFLVFNYNFIGDDVLSYEVILTIRKADNTVYLFTGSKGRLSEDTNTNTNLAIARAAKIEFSTTPYKGLALVGSNLKVSLPDFYLGSAIHESTEISVKNVSGMVLYHDTNRLDKVYFTIPEEVINLSDILIVEAVYKFSKSVLQVGNRIFIKNEPKTALNFTLEQLYLSPIEDNSIRIIAPFSNIENVEYFLSDRLTSRILKQSEENLPYINIPMSIITGYKEVLLTVICKTKEHGIETGIFRLKVEI